MAVATAWFFHYSTSFCLDTCLFTNWSSFSACIMVLPKLAIVLSWVTFLCPLPHWWRFAVHVLWLQPKTKASAELAGVLLMLFFAWNVAKHVWKARINLTLKFFKDNKHVNFIHLNLEFACHAPPSYRYAASPHFMKLIIKNSATQSFSNQ